MARYGRARLPLKGLGSDCDAAITVYLVNRVRVKKRHVFRRAPPFTSSNICYFSVQSLVCRIDCLFRKVTLVTHPRSTCIIVKDSVTSSDRTRGINSQITLPPVCPIFSFRLYLNVGFVVDSLFLVERGEI